MKESEIRIGIKRYLRTLGISVWDHEQGRRARVDPGFPDLFWIWPAKGWIGFWEVKTEKGTLSAHQAGFATDLAIATDNATHLLSVDYFIPRSIRDAEDRLLELGLLEEGLLNR